MMMREIEWIKEYFMLDFNFGSNHKGVRRDNISKIGSEVTISSVHRFLGSQNEKPRTEPNKVYLDWFGSVLNQTRQGRIPFRFGSVWTFGLVGFVKTTFTPK